MPAAYIDDRISFVDAGAVLPAKKSATICTFALIAASASAATAASRAKCAALSAAEMSACAASDAAIAAFSATVNGFAGMRRNRRRSSDDTDDCRYSPSRMESFIDANCRDAWVDFIFLSCLPCWAWLSERVKYDLCIDQCQVYLQIIYKFITHSPHDPRHP